MKNLLIALICILPSLTIGVEQSKDEMRKNLEDYVRNNQEASTSIMPLINKVRDLLNARDVGKKEAPAAEEKKK